MIARIAFVLPIAAMFVCGCTMKIEYAYERITPSQAPEVVVNGIKMEITENNWIEYAGPPTYRVKTPDGEICIWRDDDLAKFLPVTHRRLSDKGHTDWVMAFDFAGLFRVVDATHIAHIDGFCDSCGEKLGDEDTARCSTCTALRQSK